MLGPLVLPKLCVIRACLLVLYIWPKSGHSFPSNLIRNGGIKGFRSAIGGITSGGILGPQTVDSEVIRPICRRIVTSRVACSITKLGLVSVGEYIHVPGGGVKRCYKH